MVVTKLTFLTYFCIIYMIILLIIYFSKERIKNEENKIFVIMMVANIIGLFLQLLSAQCSYQYNTLPVFVSDFVIKLYLAYFIIFGLLMLTYIVILANKDNKDKVLTFSFALYLFATLIIFFLPMSVHLDLDNLIFYSYGPAVSYSFAVGGVTSVILVCLSVINRKQIPKKKMIPLFMYLIMAGIAIIIQKNNPELMIVCYIESLMCFLMFHTIENPDMLMVEELSKAQKLSEKTANDKNTFLYTISSDIEKRIDKIDSIYSNIINAKSEEESKYYLSELKENLDNSRNMLRRTIDISDMDAIHLQTTNNKYNLKLLLESVYSLKKKDINKDIDFRLNLSDDLPEELYGDSIKLKQILASILDNSIKYTDKGSVEFRVSSVIKNDVARLFFTVEDTGKGIDIFKQNEIMSDNHDLEKEEIESLDNMDLNLKVVRKMINVIGGTFAIDSNNYGGTTINITIDQKIVHNELSKEEEQIVKYSESLKNQKTCAVITLDKNDSKFIKKYAKKYNFKVSEFNVTKNALDNIRNNVNYDIVIIDEFMEKIDARSLLKKLKDEDFKGKVLVISKNKDIKTKKELIDEGFDGIIYKPFDKKDLESKLKGLQ